MPVPRMQVGRHREQAAVLEDAIAGTVRIPVRLEPPPEKRGNVTGYMADGKMARDRLQPRVAVSDQHDESGRGEDGQQVPDEELVRPCDIVFQVEPRVPLAQMFPDGGVREFTVRVAEDEVEGCRPFGLMRHTVVGGQQPDYRGGTRFRLADAERPHAGRATVRSRRCLVVGQAPRAALVRGRRPARRRARRPYQPSSAGIRGRP